MGRTIWIAFAAILVSALLAPIAQAGDTPRRDTKLTLQYEGAFNGKVRSVAKCEANRKVVLFQDSPGSVPPEPMDMTTSGADGSYAFEPNWYEVTSEYFTKARRKQAGGVICKPGKSPRFSFGA